MSEPEAAARSDQETQLPPADPFMRPRVVQITAAAILPERDLFARLDALAALPEPARAAYAVQLRDPELPARALADLGRRLCDRTRSIGAKLIINDRLDLALAVGADGVHLGRRSVTIADARRLIGDGAWISVACHAIDEVVRAAGEGAGAVVLSPIFPSPGKGPAIGVAAIAEAREAIARRGLHAQIIALGGVTAATAGACFAAGADAAAAIRADLTPVLLDAFPRSC